MIACYFRFLIDRTDGRVKVRQNGVWLNLTRTANLTSITYDFNTSVDTAEGVIIGSTTSLASGVLVLESTNKALMLPRVVSPHLNIKSPSNSYLGGVLQFEKPRSFSANMNQN